MGGAAQAHRLELPAFNLFAREHFLHLFTNAILVACNHEGEEASKLFGTKGKWHHLSDRYHLLHLGSVGEIPSIGEATFRNFEKQVFAGRVPAEQLQVLKRYFENVYRPLVKHAHRRKGGWYGRDLQSADEALPIVREMMGERKPPPDASAANLPALDKWMEDRIDAGKSLGDRITRCAALCAVAMTRPDDLGSPNRNIQNGMIIHLAAIGANLAFLAGDALNFGSFAVVTARTLPRVGDAPEDALLRFRGQLTLCYYHTFVLQHGAYIPDDAYLRIKHNTLRTCWALHKGAVLLSDALLDVGGYRCATLMLMLKVAGFEYGEAEGIAHKETGEWALYGKLLVDEIRREMNQKVVFGERIFSLCLTLARGACGGGVFKDDLEERKDAGLRFLRRAMEQLIDNGGADYSFLLIEWYHTCAVVMGFVGNERLEAVALERVKEVVEQGRQGGYHDRRGGQLQEAPAWLASPVEAVVKGRCSRGAVRHCGVFGRACGVEVEREQAISEMKAVG